MIDKSIQKVYINGMKIILIMPFIFFMTTASFAFGKNLEYFMNRWDREKAVDYHFCPEDYADSVMYYEDMIWNVC